MATLNQLVTIGAPLLGSVLGGPPGLALGAVSLVTQALGLPNDSSVEAIAKEIQTNPDVTIKLQELEANYQQYLVSIRLQMDQAEYADRASARSREVDITKATGKRDWYSPALGAFVVASFTAVLLTLFYKPLNRQNDQTTTSLINILVGSLTAGYSTVLAYYFGSSAGSRNKDNTIAGLTADAGISAVSAAPPSPPILPATPTPPATPSSLRKSWREP
jgi:hypothetical protein